MRQFLLIGIAVITLSGCGIIPNTQINTIAKADSEWALKDAQAHNDQELVPCYTVVDQQATADLASGKAPTGILSTFQVARDECRNLTNILQSCSPVAKAAPIIYATIVGIAAKACQSTP